MATEHTRVEHSSCMCMKTLAFFRITLGHFDGSQRSLPCFSRGSGARRVVGERRRAWREQNGPLELASTHSSGEDESREWTKEVSHWSLCENLGKSQSWARHSVEENGAQHHSGTRWALGNAARFFNWKLV